jgi:hypothetical protein
MGESSAFCPRLKHVDVVNTDIAGAKTCKALLNQYLALYIRVQFIFLGSIIMG